jgi:ATP-dependent helicase HrpA
MTDPAALRPSTPPEHAGGASGRGPGPALDPRVTFPAALPITARLDDIAAAIAAHQVIVIAGETGSGKTTQLPKLCLAMGRAGRGQIACTQPRRLAATSVAARVAEELQTELGDVVGYKVRFSDRARPTTAIKFLTDGMLLAEIQGDAALRAYDTIIVDEAHERSLNIDFLLGFLRRLLPRRPELRVIISSATLETARFAAFFAGPAGPAPVLEVSGRTYPVDVLYRPPRDDEPDLADAVANTVNEITELDPRGDVLVFLPGEREIREAAAALEQRALPHTMVLPLYARMPAGEQQQVFRASSQRRVVLATNVAETSLTIPGITYVVDAGLARINRYNTRTGVTQLLVEPVSRASADQRKGRCGRTASGVCFRLYEEHDYASRPAHTDPEIKRVGLAAVILRMKALRLGDVDAFPFLDPPHKRAIDEGYRVLEELGALDERGDLTAIGHELGRLPLDPRLGRMILGGRDEGALREVVVIAAVLGLQDPRERPREQQAKADEAHRKFKEEGTDFAGYLKLWAVWHGDDGTTPPPAGVRAPSNAQRRKLCREHFLSWTRMREWEDLHAQLVRVMRDLDIPPNERPATSEQLHRALLPGLLSKIGTWHQDSRSYLGARQTRFVLHPSSVLARKPPAWVMAAELVETSQLFARTVAKLDPAWLERAGGALCKRSHGDPHWDQRQAQVVAREQVTLYGLTIVKDRRVAYAPYDPALCRELLITHALCRGEYDQRAPFMEHNQRLLAELQHLRDKVRRHDLVAEEDALWRCFDARLPPEVVSGKTFEAWRKVAEARTPRLLWLSRDEVLLAEHAALSPARYPDRLQVSSVELPLSYRFDPGEDDDGASATVPLAVLPQLDPERMGWTIPGWLPAHLDALIESLPRAQRKALQPQGELVAALASELVPFSGPLLPALERAIFVRTGERIARSAWDLPAVPAYFALNYRVVDEHDRVVASGRDLAELQRTLAGRARDLWARAPRERFERTGVTAWDFGDLPATMAVQVGGRSLVAYPALVETEAGVDLKLLESRAAADAASRAGVRRLLLLAQRVTLHKLEAEIGRGLGQALVVPGAPLTPVRQLVLRALDEAFELADPAALPRSKAAFEQRLAQGRARLTSKLTEHTAITGVLSAELDKVRAAMKPLAARAGYTRTALDDLQGQLRHLVPPDLLRATPATRLAHIARYLKAMQVRLQRLAHDPMKDQQKAALVTPAWQRYQQHAAAMLARGEPAPELEAYGWLVEELRVQTFAPELKTAVPVSPPRLDEAWAHVFR